VRRSSRSRRSASFAGPLTAQLRLEYEPKVNPHTADVVGAEALLRWAHPMTGLVPASELLRVAVATGYR
jgi:EAL domain-containing protein (putative c-di-GMP-specific phosphodiesterase class I)